MINVKFKMRDGSTRSFIWEDSQRGAANRIAEGKCPEQGCVACPVPHDDLNSCVHSLEIDSIVSLEITDADQKEDVPQFVEEGDVIYIKARVAYNGTNPMYDDSENHTAVTVQFIDGNEYTGEVAVGDIRFIGRPVKIARYNYWFRRCDGKDFISEALYADDAEFSKVHPNFKDFQRLDKTKVMCKE